MVKRLFAVALGLAFVAGLSVSGVLAQGKGDAAAGKAVYEKECAKCHGDKGMGDGPQGMKLKDKPSNWTAGGGGLKGMDDAKISESIHKGGKAVGKSAAMPAYPKLSEAEVANVVAYVKTLQK
jgi:mono/diheme cytochrome c family protein